MSSVKSPLTCPAAVMRWKQHAEHWSRQTGVPTALILAVIDQESDGRPNAERPEPTYLGKLKTTPAGAHKIKVMQSVGIPPEQAATSYGLMQPLLMLAYGYGAKSKHDLLDPNKNIRYCTAHIAVLAKQTGTGYTDTHILKIAGAYNGAGANSTYARDILTLYKKYQTYLS